MRKFLNALKNAGGAGLTQKERAKQVTVLKAGFATGTAYTLCIAAWVWLIGSWFGVVSGTPGSLNLFMLLSNATGGLF